jgi:hypothetical protein
VKRSFLFDFFPVIVIFACRNFVDFLKTAERKERSLYSRSLSGLLLSSLLCTLRGPSCLAAYFLFSSFFLLHSFHLSQNVSTSRSTALHDRLGNTVPFPLRFFLFFPRLYRSR